MWPIQGGRRISPKPTQKQTQPVPRSGSPPRHENADSESKIQFDGDFFGNDYGDADFPFPEEGVLLEGVDSIDVEDKSVCSDSHSDSDSSDKEDSDETTHTHILQAGHGHGDGRAPPSTRLHVEHETLMEEERGDRMDVDEDSKGTAPAPVPTAPGGAPLKATTALENHQQISQSLVATLGNGLGGLTYAGYVEQMGGGEGNIWAPFQSKLEWEVAQWAKLRGPGSTAFTELLEIEGVLEGLGLSFNSNELNKLIDMKLPTKRPAFTRHEVKVASESYDLFMRDIIACIRALYSDREHARYLVITPERHYADPVEAITLGATIIPIILSSDKTQIMLFRNKSAYPIYLIIGNLPKSIRRKPSQQGQILLAYLPVSRLLHINNKAAQWRTQANLFHACMNYICAPLKLAGVEGLEIMGGDGVVRRGHPILAVYVGDYPEQVLITGTFSGDCPGCDCPNKELGAYPCKHPYRDIDAALDALEQLGTPEYAQVCREAGLKPIQHPFWEELPYVNIFQSITPDVLHQMHQGVVKHLLGWLKTALKCLPPNHSIRIFNKGISSLSRLSGTEHRQISSFLLGLLINVQLPDGVSANPLIRATHAILDFLYLAQYPVHTAETLASLDHALEEFHNNKYIFETLGIRSDFNIPKLHFLLHYLRAIKLFGTTANYNTETTERLQMDFAKDAYQATNHKDEFTQMTKWLERQEKIMHHANYIAWRTQMSQEPQTTTAIVSPPPHLWEPPDMACVLHPKMTRHPTCKSVSLEDITSPDGYGAQNFETALCQFIVQFQNPKIMHCQIEEASYHVHLPFRSLPVFHKIKFWNEQVHGNTTLDSIHAYSAQMKNGSITRPSRFDTALVFLKKSDITGMRIGQVRVIFSLPDKHLKSLFPSGQFPPRHLAYVEWFSRFSPHPDPNLKMYKVSRVITHGERLASVIPVSLIQRSVHLFPKWGRNPGRVALWTSENVLEECDTFYLNSFKDRHTYFNVY
ncbi:hypothetical protein M413DRAFT_16473 [Hebeloma cylindrosporum]|uniref:Uncharacterized protein n=1 Tax=Hebeloma cylindrosporum TaxID=76867 RepID=A0A0C2Z124_HEBCY|nr:hypothetical protein M413DRAFT_16473 [Hebeloma cylindrosporum h7]